MATYADTGYRENAGVKLNLEGHGWIKAHEGKIIQVLINLLVNAADAIPEADKGTMRITLRNDGEEAKSDHHG